MIKVENSWWGYFPLIIIIVIIFVILNSAFFQNTFYSPMPNSLHASDAYQDLAYLNDLVEVGNYNRESQFIIGFTGDTVSPIEPPLKVFYLAFISNLLGIPTYAAALFGLLLGTILSIGIIYTILKKCSFVWAMGYLPVTLFLFTFPFIAGITWGFWKAYFMFFVLTIAFLFFLTKLTPVKLAMFVITISGIFLASPAIFIFVLLLFVIKVLLEWSELKKNLLLSAISGIIIVILIFNFLLTFLVVREQQGSLIQKILYSVGFQKGYHLYSATPYASNFGLFWYVAIFGFIYAHFYLFNNFKNRNNYKFKMSLLFVFFFIIFLLPSLGVTRVYQFRLVWPLYVSVFIGLIFYLSVTYIQKQLKVNNLIITSGIVFLFFTGGMLFYLEFPKSNQSLTSLEQWDAYMYLKENTSKIALILVIEPAMAQNGILMVINRRVRYLDMDSFSNAARIGSNLGKVNPKFNCLIREKRHEGLKVFSNTELIRWCEAEQKKVYSICSYDYILIDKQFLDQQQVKLTQDFIESINITNFSVIKNGQVLLLENKRVCKNEIQTKFN